MITTGIRRALAAAGLAAASLPLAALPAHATHTEPTEPNGGQVVDECYGSLGQANSTARRMCRHVEQLTRNVAQVCRFARAAVPTPEAACSAIDGRAHSPEAMTHYEQSWVHRALGLQSQLDDTAPLIDALFPATHNSFNSAAYPPTLSGLDHNNVAGLTDQLRMDMRGLELDVHWFPSPYADPADGGRAPILCHGTTVPVGPVAVHFGCTAERHLREGLAEIDAWLGTHPDEFLLLYLENQLDNDLTAHNAAARAIEAELGGRVHRPTGACAEMPADLSEADILAAGKQVVIVGNCGPGAAWGSWVHVRGPRWDEDKSGVGDDFVCPPGGFPNTFRRYYEDSTWFGATLEPTGLAGPGEITVNETRAMVACGVNLFGFDQLVPGDPRLEALVWSWARNEPGASSTGGVVAYQGADGRFGTSRRGPQRSYACRASGAWYVTSATGKWKDGQAACSAERPGSDFAVPGTGADNAALVAVKQAAGAAEVWLDYARVRGTWTPNP